MTVSLEECRALLVDFRAKHGAPIERWEMSTETLRQLEAQLPPLTPTNVRATALWGVPLTINEDVPTGAIKPIYA